MSYNAPIALMRAMLVHAAGIEEVSALEAFAEFDSELIDPILDEAGKLARDVIAPTNQPGHHAGAVLTSDGVKTAPGMKEAYKAFCDGGWTTLTAPVEFGGQGLPKSMSLALMDMMMGANMAFSLCPLLAEGAIDALHRHGSLELRAHYLPKMTSGEWACAMALTEPQAGSDLGAMKTKATPNENGSYAISGQKIYITYGDHDFTDNIVHLVLARLPDAPEGPKGISLFLVSKYLLNSDESLGDRNSFKCIGLEKKMGIHASPTCVMEYDGAVGYMIGEPNRGLAAMFTMMNAARLQVGIQGVGVAEATGQAAIAYAAERKQFGRLIQDMPDIQRMIARIRATTLASRAICYAASGAEDMAKHHPDEDIRLAQKQRENLLIPIAKAWASDRAVEAAGLSVQVHGGMGFMNETLACQHYQDIRIAPIYEGTNGIQALDLIGRKLAGDNGLGMAAMLAEIRETAARAENSEESAFNRIGARLTAAADALSETTDWMLAAQRNNSDRAEAGATAYLKLAGDVVGGFYLARAAMDMTQAGDDAQTTKEVVALTAFYAEDILSTAPGAVSSVTHAADVLSENVILLSGRI